jgi:hypothetical protein
MVEQNRRNVMNGKHYQVHHYLGMGAVVVSLPLLLLVLTALKTAIQWREDSRDTAVDWGMCIG